MGDPLVSCVREKQKKSGLVSKSLLKMHRCSLKKNNSYFLVNSTMNCFLGNTNI